MFKKLLISLCLILSTELVRAETVQECVNKVGALKSSLIQNNAEVTTAYNQLVDFVSRFSPPEAEISFSCDEKIKFVQLTSDNAKQNAAAVAATTQVSEEEASAKTQAEIDATNTFVKQCSDSKPAREVNECVRTALADRCKNEGDIPACMGRHERVTGINTASPTPVAPGNGVAGTAAATGGDSDKLMISGLVDTSTEPLPLQRKVKFNISTAPKVRNSYGYSDAHIKCEGELAQGTTWEKALDRKEGWWAASMQEFVTHSQYELSVLAKDGISKQSFTAWYDAKIKEVKERTETYESCTALIYSLSGRVDLNDSSTTEGVGKGGKYEVASATKPDLKCVTYMYETVDFKACKNALNAFDGAFIAEQGMGVYQNYDFQSKNMDRQSDLNQKQLKGETIDTTDALGMQKGAVQDQASVANQRAAFSAAKVGLLATMLAKMPSAKEIEASCNNGKDKTGTDNNPGSAWYVAVNNFNDWMTSLTITSPASGGKLMEVGFLNGQRSAIALSPVAGAYEGACKSVQGLTASNDSSSDWTVQLIRNQDIKTKIKAEMIKAGVDMAGNLAKAALLNKQAGEIDDVINSINKFEPPPLPENQMTDMQILECQANPQAENCGTINGRGNVGFSSNGINVGNGQFATSDGQGIDLGNTDGTTANSATSKSDRAGMARKLGGATADAPGDAGILNPVSAAEVKNGGGNPGGGGGGAGATAPGAAAGGGGAGGKPGAGGSGSGGQGLAKMKFSGSSAGSLSWSGGGGLARKPAAKADNPFANLLGKGGSKNGVLDGFRGPASGIGKKEDGLFNMISNRYSQVANDKERLIQYEIKK